MPARTQDDTVRTLARAVRSADRSAIGRAITLVESRRADHVALASGLLAELTPHSGAARRIGVTGVPGVGKSTMIEALGTTLIEAGHRVAVLAIDPSSRRSGGSILGDRTRMPSLAAHPNAFVRPSPSGGVLGGVANATRAAMVVVEAAGFDVVLVETVGVGQSEFLVADMVDSFLFLTMARTGDQLQGMKRGILELADVVAVNKADGEHIDEADLAARELLRALRMVRGADGGWQPPVLTCSARLGVGISEIWAELERHRAELGDGLRRRRLEQQVSWSRAMVAQTLLAAADGPAVRAVRAKAEAELVEGLITANEVARRVLAEISRTPRPSAAAD